MEPNACLSRCMCVPRLLEMPDRVGIAKILNHGICFNIRNYTGNTFIHRAVEREGLEIVKESLEQPDAVRKTNRFRETPLHVAVNRAEGFEIVKQLLQHGACTNSPNNLGNTPLHYAVGLGCALRTVKHLLEYGGNPVMPNIFGVTPLHLAAFSADEPQVINELIKYGASVDVLDFEDDTPLHFAAHYTYNLVIVKKLLKLGADVSKTNYMGRTPLHQAVAAEERIGIIKELLQHGALVHVADVAGYTPLDFARGIVPLKLLMKYALIQGFEGDYRKLFNSERFKELENNDMLKHFFANCVSEVCQMQTTMVNARVSLYKLVTTKTNVALHRNNYVLSDIIDKETLFLTYPIYGDIISPKVELALERATLLDKYIFTWFNGALVKTEVQLNHDCVSLIAEFLSNKDLRNFILAFQKPCQVLN